MKPSIITSKAAQRDLDKIRLFHTNLTKDIAAHQQRVALTKQQESQDSAQQKQAQENKVQQDRMFGVKQAELSIKAQPHGLLN